MRITILNMFLLVCSLKLVATTLAYGQELDNIKVTLEINNESLKNAFEKIEKQTNLLFSYNAMVNANTRVNLPQGTYSVKEVLDRILKDTPLKFRLEGRYIIVYTPEKIEKEEKTNERVVTVTGKVIDATQMPIVGVNIIVKGTTTGTTTDINGKFVVEATEADILIFSFIGFITKEIAVDQQTKIDVLLETDVVSLQEVTVNAGYYNVTDREKTGSISRVSAKEIERQPVTNPLQTLQGRVPGISINQFSGVPGSSFQVRIRGTNSLSNGNDPLYVIDGVPFISESMSDLITSGNLYGVLDGKDAPKGISPLNSINPNDIESIEVLKDADATAIYGSRGANGVILITTKKGKPGAVKVDVNVKTGVSKVMQRIDLMKTQAYIAMRMEAVTNDGETVPRPDEFDINGTWDQNRYTNWQDVFFGGTANMTDLNASISGGNNETQFLFGVGYNNQSTVFPGDNSAGRFSTHFSVTHDSPNKKFHSRISNSYSVNNSNIVCVDLTGTAFSLAPNSPALFDGNGELNWENSTWRNPLSNLENRFGSHTFNLLTNVDLRYEIVKGLSIKASIGLNDIRNEEKRTFSSDATDPAYASPANSKLYIGAGTNRSWIAEPQINWERTIGKGKLSALLGGTYQSRTGESSSEIFEGFPSNALINDPNSAATTELLSYNFTEYRYCAIYARINYSWDQKYILNITGRRDGSSRFGPGRQFANLGAVGFAWIFSNEDFLKDNLRFLSFGKLRGSYGFTGNDQIGDYRFLDAYRSGLQYQGITSLVPTQLFNPDYGWEVNKKIEAAIELGFLEDRILLTTAYYRNRSSNQLIDYKLAGTTGFPSILQNFQATVQNTGVEVEVNSINIIKGSFKWSSSFNITFPSNKLVDFPNLESSSYASSYIVGKPLNIAKRYHYLGVDQATGLYQFEDVNSDGQLTLQDKTSIIVGGQRYYGGLNNSFSYGNLQFDIFFQFVNQRAVTPYISNGTPGSYYLNQPVNIVEGRWQNSEDIASRQLFSRSAEADDAQENYSASDAASTGVYFIRLKNIAISYQLPDKLLSGVKSRIYVQGQNLFTMTDYVGLDPETGSDFLPPLTTLVAGVQLTF